MTRKAYQFQILLTRSQVEEANKAVANGFRMENGTMSTAKHFSSKWSVSINKSTTRKLNI